MAEVSTTKPSSRGQIVIPEVIRRRLGLGPGAQFVFMSGIVAGVVVDVLTPLREDYL